MKTDIRDISDIKIWYDEVILVTQNFRSQTESKKVVDITSNMLYDLFMDVYELGRRDKLNEIKKTLKI